MVLPGPVHHGIDNIIVNHPSAYGQIASAGGSVGKCTVLQTAAVITRRCPLQPGIRILGVIVHHIHNNPYARPVQGLDHLLALPDAHRPVMYVRSIRTLRHIVIHRVIAPVKLLFVPLLVQPAIVKKRQQMHMGDAQLFQIGHTGGIFPIPCRFPRLQGKRLIFSAVSLGNPTVRIMGKIFDMKFIDNIFYGPHGKALLLKPLRIGPLQIYRHTAVAVAAAAYGVGIRRPQELPVRPNAVVIIITVIVSLQTPMPDSLLNLLHIQDPGDYSLTVPVFI